MLPNLATSPSRLTARKWKVVAGLLGVAVVAGVTLIFFMNGTRAKEPAAAAKGPIAIPVTVVKALRQTVAFRLQAIGNVEAFSTVSVKARVDGQIVEVGFREGQEVRKDSVLFRIDPRPYEATLRQAEAVNARDVAAREQARAQERRYKDLLEKNFISNDAYAQYRTNAETAAAVADASQAAVDNARLNLEYCTIRSPIDGYTGRIQIQIGNLVKANDAPPLVVLNQVHPIYVTFAVPEQTLPAIRGYLAKGPLTVDASSSASGKLLASGALVFIDNAVDASTGTIKLRARFANRDNALWPGQFVNTSLKLYDQKDAIVVPAAAIQTGPDGQYVFVIRPDMTAEIRKVAIDRTDGDNAIIASGLQADEMVVTRGQLRLGPGAKVSTGS